MSALRPWPAVAALALAQACGTPSGPPPRELEPEVGIDVPAEWVAGAPGDGPVEGAFWRRFDDPELDRLVQRALERNHDVRAAAARMQRASALARVVGADLWPQVDATFDALRQKQVFVGFPFGGGGVASSRSTQYGLALNMTWEIDLWGRLRARQSAAVADFEASRAELEGAFLSLAAQTSKAWFATLEARRQVEIGEDTVAAAQRTADEVRDRVETGLSPTLDLDLATSDLNAARAAVERRREAYALQVRQLEILLGDYPTGERSADAELPAVPGPVPAGLPSELVRRRPDLVAAERRLAASGALVESADAALYPRVALTASGGTVSNHLSDLVDGDFGVWSIGAGLLQPIFQGGRLIAQADVARAEETEALENWASAVLVAFAEVESALATEQPLREQEAQLAAAVESSRRALQQGQDRYRQGVESLLTVLETQRRVLDNESRLVNVRRQRLDNRVDLHLALGGGFAPPTETAPPSTPPNDPRSSR